jgi:hypothetical protein
LDVCFAPKPDSCNAAILSLFDYLVGADKQQKRRGNSVDKNFKFDAVQQLHASILVCFIYVTPWPIRRHAVAIK